VFLKEIKCGDLKYGIRNYDYEEGTLVFLTPGQVIGSHGDELYQPQDANKSVSDIAYELGFKYPQHFTRVFKQHTGVTPQEYRNSMN
jgi:AraC-like DNA-binding protein